MALADIDWSDSVNDRMIQLRVMRAMCRKAKEIWREYLTLEPTEKGKIAVQFATEIITGLRQPNQNPTHMTQLIYCVADEIENLQDDAELAIKVEEAIDLAIEARFYKEKAIAQ